MSLVGRQRNESNAADLAAAAITITTARLKVVNFIKPFQHTGLTVVTRRPDIHINIPYSFGIFQPLEPAVWGLILLALIVVSRVYTSNVTQTLCKRRCFISARQNSPSSLYSSVCPTAKRMKTDLYFQPHRVTHCVYLP